MAKETNFEHPPKGHVGLLAYDSVNDRFQVVYVDASGNLQVDVIASGLPSGAATAAKQLPDGHNVTVDNASLAVTAGNDKIFAFDSVVANYVTGTISGASGYISSGAVPTGKIWVITGIVARDATSALTAMLYVLNHDGVGYDFNAETRAIAAGERVSWQGNVYLDGSDTITVWFLPGVAGDTCHLYVTGYQMDAP